MDWIKFQCLLDDQTNLRIPLKTPDDIDSAIQNFTEMIQGCAWESSRPRRSCSSSTPPLNLPQHVRLLIGAKRRARAAWQRYRYPSDFITLKKLTRQLQSQLSSLRSDCYNSYISSLDSRDHSLWRATKRILSFHPTSYPLRGSDGSWARSDKERADEFGTHLNKVFTPTLMSLTLNIPSLLMNFSIPHSNSHSLLLHSFHQKWPLLSPNFLVVRLLVLT